MRRNQRLTHVQVCGPPTVSSVKELALAGSQHIKSAVLLEKPPTSEFIVKGEWR